MGYEEWTTLNSNKLPATSGFSDEIFEHVKTGGKVLDLGCGFGRIAGLLKSHGYEVFGVDTNANAIQEAKDNPELSGITFDVQNAKETHFNNGSFDAVVEQAVLACMTKEDRVLVMQEVKRVLKDGGVFSIAEFGMHPDNTERYEKDANIAGEYGTMIVRKEDGSEWFRSHNFSKGELDELITATGFTTIYYETVPFKTVKGKLHPGHMYIVRKEKV